MNKVNVTICVGTACYVIGGSELMNLAEVLPPELAEAVEFNYSECMGTCTCSEGNKNPPYVTVNEQLISNATVERVLEAINDELNQ